MKRIIFALTGLAVLFSSCNKKQQSIPDADNRYAVMTVGSSSAEIASNYPATIRGVQDVEIRPKISGFITKIYVQEGQAVTQGQALFSIDSEQYQAAVRSAEEAVKAATQQINVVQSNIATQQLAVDNKKMLYDKKIISDYDYQSTVNQLQSLKAQLGSAKAQLGSAQAQLKSARANLGFCTVLSPASGNIGMLPQRVGALVGPTMVEPFTTVSNTSRIYAYFSMTEKQILEMSRTGKGGVQSSIKHLPAVGLKLADGTVYEEKGTVDAVGGTIDPATGAVQVRATFNNPHRILRSGGSASIILPTFNSQAIQVPQSAVVEIQDKKFVYVVGSNNKVKSTEISINPESDGNNYIITGGLKVGDRIVIEGVQTLKADMEIKPISKAEADKLRQEAKKDIKDGKLPF